MKIAGYSPRIAILILIAIAVLPELIRQHVDFSPEGKKLLILLLLLPFAALPTLTLKSSESSYHFFRMLSFVSVIPVIIYTIQDEIRLRLIVTTLIIGSLVSCVFAYLQAIYGEAFYEVHYRILGQYYSMIEGLPKYLRDNRPFGLSTHSIDFGYDTLLIYGLLFAFFKYRELILTTLKKRFIFPLLFFMTGALAINVTRSVILSLILLLPISEIIFEKGKTLKYSIYYIILFVLTLSIFLLIDLSYERLTSFTDSSLSGRVGLYIAGLSSIIANPILGVGPDDATGFSRYFMGAGLSQDYLVNLDISAVHNNYMNAYLSYGSLFFFMLIIVIAKTLSILWKNYHASGNRYMSVVSAGLFIGIVLYMIDIFFHNGGTFTHAFFWIFPGLALTIDCIMHKNKQLERFIN